MGFLGMFRRRRPGDSFDPAESPVAFEDYLLDAGGDVGSLTVDDAVTHVLGFYESVRADSLPPDQDGDMLLYQWGTHDWGRGPSFQFDLTRQFMVPPSGDDEGISQLHVTLHFPPSESLGTLGSGSHWCESLSDVEEFRGVIRSSAPYRALVGVKPEFVDFDWEPV